MYGKRGKVGSSGSVWSSGFRNLLDGFVQVSKSAVW